MSLIKIERLKLKTHFSKERVIDVLSKNIESVVRFNDVYSCYRGEVNDWNFTFMFARKIQPYLWRGPINSQIVVKGKVFSIKEKTFVVCHLCVESVMLKIFCFVIAAFIGYQIYDSWHKYFYGMVFLAFGLIGYIWFQKESYRSFLKSLLNAEDV